MIYIILLIYCILIIALIIGFIRVPIFIINPKIKEKQKFTIIVPFRNEAINIPSLAESLRNIQYKQSFFEIIWVNDQSTDNSVPLLTEYIIKEPNWKLIDNLRRSNSPKKDAISTAIVHGNFEWIITTDADCIIPANWLKSYNQFIEKNEKINLIAAPVAYQTNNILIHQFQNMDFLSLIGTTIGAFGIEQPFICNGANLCYRKTAFFEVNGFDGNDSISSGDDVFILEKIKNINPKQVGFLKSNDALVQTKPINSLTNLINQRIRWASKTSSTKSNFAKMVGLIVIAMNILVLWILLFKFWFINDYRILGIILIKWMVDYILIKKTSLFLNGNINVKSYSISSLLYPLFVVIIMFLSFFKNPKWKGREI